MAFEKTEDYGGRFMYAEHLLVGGDYRTVAVVIEEVIPPGTLKAANGKMIDKPTIKFKGKDKMLVLCNTNVAMIRFSTGDTLENSIGKTITLQPRIVDAFGDKVVALRVIPPAGEKVRRSVLMRLGTKAEWHGEPTPEPTKQ